MSKIKGFESIDTCLRYFNIGQNDIKIMQKHSAALVESTYQFIDEFYNWLPLLPEYNVYFTDDAIIKRLKRQQAKYWNEFFGCELNEEYLKNRFIVGKKHAEIKLPIGAYCAAMSFSCSWWVKKINQLDISETEKSKLLVSFNKLTMMDTAMVCAVYNHETNEIISAQSRTLLELSTPTIQLWESILVLPIVGIIDSKRVQEMTDIMLQKIIDTEAKVIILDIQGVPSVDSSVANHLIKITKATWLMGCECVLSGISPAIAQTLVHLGADLEGITTTSNLKSAFKLALIKANYRVSIDDETRTE